MEKTLKLVNDNGDEQYFTKLTSRASLKAYLKIMRGSSGTWTDDDSSLYVEYVDGTHLCINEVGEKHPRINSARVKLMVWEDSACTVFFGDVEVIHNEKYGDYEIAIA